MTLLERLPKLGFGLGISANWPAGFAAARALLSDCDPQIDYLEIYPGISGLGEASRMQISQWSQMGVPMTLHAATLDLWSAENPDFRGMPLTVETCAFINPVWTTQDVMMTRCAGARAGVLLGAIFTDDSVEAIADRYWECARALGTHLLLENAPYRVIVGDLSLGEFFLKLARRTGCGLTLDIGHLLGTSLLEGKRPLDALDCYPLHRVVEIHVAGGQIAGDPPAYVDDHDAELSEETLVLLRAVLPLCTSLRAVTYEVQSPSLRELRARLWRVREVLQDVSFLFRPRSVES